MKHNMPFFIQEINLQTGWKGHIIQLQSIQEAAWKKPLEFPRATIEWWDEKPNLHQVGCKKSPSTSILVLESHEYKWINNIYSWLVVDLPLW